MVNKAEKLVDIFSQYVKETQPKAIVTQKTIILCRLTNQVNRTLLNCRGLSKIYINTIVIKHIYDKRPAEEFDFLIKYLHRIVKYPDKIYKNREQKRGEWIFVKEIKNELYLSSLATEKNKELEITTAFRIRKKNYLKKYNLIWSWEDDNPPS